MSCRVVAEPQLTVRPALEVGTVNDPAEVEADAVADMVMSMPASEQAPLGHTGSPVASPTIRRACGCGTESGDLRRTPTDVDVRRQDDEDEEMRLKRGHSGSPMPVADGGAIGHQIDSARGSGSALPSETRRFFEPRFGTSFSSVRVHANAAAADMADSLRARAFTVGRDVFFGAGQYQPGSTAGRHLIAHELTHVVQSERQVGTVRRAIELRPPGRGEASAFGRRQELVDRLNDISEAVTYRLDADDRTLLYEIDDESAMTEFDRKMTGFIDAGQIIPLRLITSAGRVSDGGGPSCH